MSATKTAPPVAAMTIVEKLEELGHEALTVEEHAAAWLSGRIIAGETTFVALKAASPLFAMAVNSAIQSVTVHLGVTPAVADVAFEAVMSLIGQLGGSLSAPAPVAPPAPSPATAA